MNMRCMTPMAGLLLLAGLCQPTFGQDEPTPDEPTPARPADPEAAATESIEQTSLLEGDVAPHDHFHYHGDGTPFNFKKVPPLRPLAFVGPYAVRPTGPGYYTAREWLEGNYREKPPKFPYTPFALMQQGFFDADFRYLDDPKNTQHDIFDPIHRVHIHDDWLWSTGGQVWWRMMNETNSRLQNKDNNYNLYRLRAYGDLWYQDKFRVYVEFIDAQTRDQDLPPQIIDRNFGDLLNAFVDIKLNDCPDTPTYLRVGRQELYYGSQRLISALDWANTRRTFQGVRTFRTTENFDVDLFWVQPVVPNAERFDSVDNNQNFAGAWTTYRPQKGQSIDMYWLWLDNTSKITQLGIVRAPYNVHTLGTRYLGDKKGWLWDVEPMLQLGERGGNDIFAGSLSVGGGKNWKDHALNPTFWLYFDYASGDRSPNHGSFTTFNQLFPFGHYYFGWADLIGRQNINDLNAHVYLWPTDWIQVWGQYHHFWLDSRFDALYNAAGNASRRSDTGAAGNAVGDEFDLIANFTLSQHSNIQLGYCYFLSGNFVQGTGAGGDTASLLYAMYNFRW